MFLEFINSQWHQNFKGNEVLYDRNWIKDFVLRFGLDSLAQPTNDNIESLIKLRNLLVTMLQEYLQNEKCSEDSWKTLNKLIESTTFHQKIEITDTIKVVKQPLEIIGHG
ncbi:hypothetical protein [Bacillus solimangrovi]|uniref:Uncharacterized protein n=1 Tax=Bacillus solimangrovi TaxID=1305675 RepID=A0A1E5LF11_9BACI|nr:hypothetical protein [Bacillus solimangrovi]OEH92662.1 hypothetical protein BFG57_01260 [Bacillus solimangrovi]